MDLSSAQVSFNNIGVSTLDRWPLMGFPSKAVQRVVSCDYDAICMYREWLWFHGALYILWLWCHIYLQRVDSLWNDNVIKFHCCLLLTVVPNIFQCNAVLCSQKVYHTSSIIYFVRSVSVNVYFSKWLWNVQCKTLWSVGGSWRLIMNHLAALSKVISISRSYYTARNGSQ